MSTDRTRDIINEWRDNNDIEIQIVDNPRRVAEFGNAEALKIARGDLIYLMGCDEECAQDDFIETSVEAFNVFPDIAGVQQYFVKIPGGSIVNNYLAVIHINDPLAMEMARKSKQIAKVRKDGKTFREFKFPAGYPARLFWKRETIEHMIGIDSFEEAQAMCFIVP